MTARARGAADGAAGENASHAHEGDRKFVVALARGLDVLRCFRARDGFLTNQEIAERTGLPKPTVTRLTYTLCQLGYLQQNPQTRKIPARARHDHARLRRAGQSRHPPCRA